MISPGLVSVTFRHLSPEEIVSLALRAGLAAVEWGGDVHVPPGDLARASRLRGPGRTPQGVREARARQVGRLTVEAGLRVCSYGSYYRAGAGEPPDFEAVLATALELGAPLVRVWAGRLGSQDASPAYWEQVAADSRRICELAARAEVEVAYEFHGGTLTDSNASARRLLEQVDHPALRCYWQPPRGASREHNLQGLEMVAPWLANLHVFHWISAGDPPAVERRPLAEGDADWPVYLRQAAADGKPRCALLEFVRGDRPEQFLEDAAALKRWLAA